MLKPRGTLNLKWFDTKRNKLTSDHVGKWIKFIFDKQTSIDKTCTFLAQHVCLFTIVPFVISKKRARIIIYPEQECSKNISFWQKVNAWFNLQICVASCIDHVERPILIYKFVKCCHNSAVFLIPTLEPCKTKGAV